RCLLNLVANAADAVPATGGCVRVTARPRDDGIEIAVADNGPGVPPELRARIFEPFFSTKGTRGTGLGLAVDMKIIEEHGGGASASRRETGCRCFCRGTNTRDGERRTRNVRNVRRAGPSRPRGPRPGLRRSAGRSGPSPSSYCSCPWCGALFD